ncbi:hypothetical protein BUALT_Bualt10G0125700 [Buddleja alternifolia]|uniref:Glycosyl hydrolase family 32 N-terminal domain-containing protein n=1 Tax=Buddleja alternifolia TaxID=168488 RepID=A0AAV6WYX4_9LAMI|nr:hypothetical protein BUALT_Bualt10G0125700 [Buddleja alternifolia]
MYYKGVYHLFYQYNPYSAVWGNISWAHSVSYDLIDWIHLENAINPTEPYDVGGCWSGSATIIPGDDKPVILYTGDNSADQQVQNLAMPKNLSDPLLREWIKSSHNPVLSPINGIDPKNYRDPTTAWRRSFDETWRVLIGSQIDGHGAAILYKSKDFINWKRTDKPLHSSNKTGMWECPDFYPVSTQGQNGLDTSVDGEDVKHVLKASFHDHDYYIIGNYDSKMETFRADVDFMDKNVQLRYDYGVFYASKSFYDGAKKRRVLWAWVTEADSESNDIQKGWSGLQADIEVSFDLPDLNGVELIDERLLDPQLLCREKNASINGVFGPFGLLVLASKDLTEQTAIFFRIFKRHEKYVVLMCSDQSRSSLTIRPKETIFGSFLHVDPNQKISLRTLIDRSIVESFGGEGRNCITARVYPGLAIGENSHIYAYNNGTKSVTISSLNAWRPMYYKGVYHLFYQYNPYSALWGNISWAHSASYDLIDWIHLENAINPSEPYDVGGCWSGSASIIPGDDKPVILYTGGSSADQQVQNLAMPKNLSDPLVREWIKFSNNPVLSPIDGIDPKNYRDPVEDGSFFI